MGRKEGTGRGHRTHVQEFQADTKTKPDVHTRIGVREYFLFDPTAEYLQPALQGFRLEAGEYQAITSNGNGRFECQTLGITLELKCLELIPRDAETGEELVTASEFADAERKISETQRLDAEKRNAELEAEVRRLRAELERQSGN